MDNIRNKFIPENLLDTTASRVNLTNRALCLLITQEALELGRTHGQILPVQIIQRRGESFCRGQHAIHRLLVNTADVVEFLE